MAAQILSQLGVDEPAGAAGAYVWTGEAGDDQTPAQQLTEGRDGRLAERLPASVHQLDASAIVRRPTEVPIMSYSVMLAGQWATDCR